MRHAGRLINAAHAVERIFSRCQSLSINPQGILKLMRDINRQSGTTFVFSTHDRKVMNMADRLVRIADGQIIALGMKADDRWVFVDGRTPRDEDIREI